MVVKISVALDGLSLDFCEAFSKEVGTHPRLHSLKIHDLVDRHGRDAIDRLKWSGARVWVDYKLHDIPDTVGRRARVLHATGADILTVHAAGGVDMMLAARDSGTEIFAVTILTSQKPRLETIRKYARMAAAAGIVNIVCPAYAITMLSQDENLANTHMQFVTPGIRRLSKQKRNHFRTYTIEEAVRVGAHILVIGSDILGSGSPVATFNNIARAVEIAESKLAPR